MADLTHVTVTVSIDTFPLGISYLAAHASAVLSGKPEFKLFRYPDDCFDSLDRESPDIMGIANYCWNLELGAAALAYARKKNPNILTVCGGPNFPVDQELQSKFLKRLPQIDYYIVGDGEAGFVHLIERFIANDRNREKLMAEFRASPFASTLAFDRDAGRVVKGEGFNRIADLDALPSPYQSGVLDKFFDGKLNPMIQTNRGCPFTCTFCLEGNASYAKVNKYGTDRVKKDLEYIAGRVSKNNTLVITDSNFGMYERDIETAQYIHGLQERIGWPKSINCTTGKNNPDGVMKVVDLVSGAIRVSSSVQSMDADVLNNVRRNNIKLDSYAKVQEKVRERNLQSLADLILCLPGESKKTHFDGIKRLLDVGVQRILPYQLMLLHGTQINNIETHQRYKFVVKHRVVPRNFGMYRGELVCETEEIVVATDTLSYQDYLDCRRLHLILEAYYKENPFAELIAFVNACGVPTSDFFFHLFEGLDQAPEDLAEVFRHFTEETEGELFDTREEVLAFMGARMEDVKEGKVGGNLLQKYSVNLWFHHLPSLVSYAAEMARTVITKKAAELDATPEVISAQIQSIEEYLKAVFVNVLKPGDVRAVKKIKLLYDVAAWKKANFKDALSHVDDEPPAARSGSGRCGRDYVFAMDEARARYVEEKLNVFGSTPQGIGKMLTRMFLKDLRRDVRVLEGRS